MKFRHIIPTTLMLLCILASSPASAGWGDALKDVGTQLADEQAKSAGLPYTPTEAIAGIKDVLSMGTGSAEATLAQSGGFSSSPATSFSLPDALMGLGSDSTGLLSSLNKAGESAIPSTGDLFMNAIQNLSIGDPTSLLGGGDTAITNFFEQSSRESLKQLIKPVVATAADKAGVGTYLNAMTAMQQASGGSATFDANDYLAEGVLDSMFYLIGEKEKAIRAGGVDTSALIQKLF